jgi:hypothetical protein
MVGGALAPDIEQGPDGNLYAVSFTVGVIYRSAAVPERAAGDSSDDDDKENT